MYDNDEEIEAGMGGEDMVEHIQPGVNVACILNDIDNPFWLMVEDKPCSIVSESFTDAWRNSFEPRDVVIRGF